MKISRVISFNNLLLSYKNVLIISSKCVEKRHLYRFLYKIEYTFTKYIARDRHVILRVTERQWSSSRKHAYLLVAYHPLQSMCSSQTEGTLKDIIYSTKNVFFSGYLKNSPVRNIPKFRKKINLGKIKGLLKNKNYSTSVDNLQVVIFFLYYNNNFIINNSNDDNIFFIINVKNSRSLVKKLQLFFY